MFAKPTRPALAGECVVASTSSGYAICVEVEPIVDSAWPVCNSTKSRFRRSGVTGPWLHLVLSAGHEQIRTADRGACGHRHDLDPVVDQCDQRGTDGDRDRLRHAEQEV